MQQQRIAPAATSCPYYTISQKVVIKQTGLFKLQKYNSQYLVFSAPDAKCIATIHESMGVDTIRKHYYNDRPLALDVVQLVGRKFVVAGCRGGSLVVRAVQQHTNHETKSMELETVQQWQFPHRFNDQDFINEVTHCPYNPNILINCYNNGNIAVWGLMHQQRLHTFVRAHQKYTYKLRFQTNNILVSCGHDCSVIRTDLQKLKYLSLYSHALPVWCAYPIDSNVVASVGLFGRVNVWDVRSGRLAQLCNNDAHESSFVTTRGRNPYQLFYGDLNMLIKWDRRKSRPELATNHNMGLSSQAILFDKNFMYVCGRGKDLCKFQGADTLTNFLPVDQVVSLAKEGEISCSHNSSGSAEEQNSDYVDEGEGEAEDEDEGDEQDWEDVEQSQINAINEESKPLLKAQSKKQNKVKIESIIKPTIQQAKQLYLKQNTWLKKKQSQQQEYEEDDGHEKEEPVKQLKQKKRQQNSKEMVEKELKQNPNQ